MSCEGHVAGVAVVESGIGSSVAGCEGTIAVRSQQSQGGPVLAATGGDEVQGGAGGDDDTSVDVGGDSVGGGAGYDTVSVTASDPLVRFAGGDVASVGVARGNGTVGDTGGDDGVGNANGGDDGVRSAGGDEAEGNAGGDEARGTGGDDSGRGDDGVGDANDNRAEGSAAGDDRVGVARSDDVVGDANGDRAGCSAGSDNGVGDANGDDGMGGAGGDDGVGVASAPPDEVELTRSANKTDAEATQEISTEKSVKRALPKLTGEALIAPGLVTEARVVELQKSGLSREAALKVAASELQKILASRQALVRGPIVAGGNRAKAVARENEFQLAGLGYSDEEVQVTRVVPGDGGVGADDDEDSEEDIMRKAAAMRAMRARRRKQEAAEVEEEQLKNANAPGCEEAGHVWSGLRPKRTAALNTVEAFRSPHWRGSTRTRRTKKRPAGSTVPEWTEEVVERLVNRKLEDGVVFYLVEWADFEGEDRFSWEPAENLVGHEEWMKLVNYYKDKVEGRVREGKVTHQSLPAWLKSNIRAIALGDEAEMRCFFLAVRAAVGMLNLPLFDVEGVVAQLDKRVFSRANGVAARESVDVMKKLVAAGFEIDCDVWSVNLYCSELGSPKDAIALSIADCVDGGVFMVATMDKMRGGHVWALEVDEFGEMTVTDNGLLKAFDKMRVSEVMWVRRCVARAGDQDLTKVYSVGVQRAKVLGIGGFPPPPVCVGERSDELQGVKRAGTGDGARLKKAKKAKRAPVEV